MLGNGGLPVLNDLRNPGICISARACNTANRGFEVAMSNHNRIIIPSRISFVGAYSKFEGYQIRIRDLCIMSKV